MEIALGFIIFLLCLVIGVRFGGLGLAAVSGIGLVIYVFGLGYKPGVPPNDVMLTILAVVTCAAFLQTSGGLTVLLKLAEKILRKEPVIILSFISACYGYFFLPTYPSDLACIGFDRSGTTKIGKYILNHSFMIPGLIGVITGCCVGYVIAHAII